VCVHACVCVCVAYHLTMAGPPWRYPWQESEAGLGAALGLVMRTRALSHARARCGPNFALFAFLSLALKRAQKARPTAAHALMRS
jgi:hypothetical protein